MKKLLFAVCGLAAVVLLSTGCKSTGTRSTTKFYDPNGKLIAEHKERTRSAGLFVASETVGVQGTISYTNTAPGFTVSETKDFKAEKLTSKSDAESIKAAGDAVGNVAGQVINKAVGK